MKPVHFRDWLCNVEKAKYTNGRTALYLVDAEDGERIATATVNLPDVTAGPNEVFIKSYSENAGLLESLTNAGIIKPTGRTVQTGYATVSVCELQPPYCERPITERATDKRQRGR